MNRIIKIYKPFCFIEIILGVIGTAAFLSTRVFDLADIIIVLLIYLSTVASLVIVIKLINATENKIRLSDEVNIVGHIGNCIKLLVVIVALITAIHFFSITIKFVTSISTRSIIYYIVMFSFFILAIVSLFNFYVYIRIASMNKRIRFSEVDDIGSDINKL
jgi:hypothetical protein